MRRSNYFIVYLLFCIVQALFDNFFLFPQYVVLSILPALIMSLPPKHGTPFAIIVAFLTGALVDFIGTGTLGLTSMALMPVALMRMPILRLISEDDYVFYSNDSPAAHQSTSETILCCIFANIIYFAVFIPVESAGTRPFWFDALRFLISCIVSSLLGFLLSFYFSRRQAVD